MRGEAERSAHPASEFNGGDRRVAPWPARTKRRDDKRMVGEADDCVSAWSS
jgi:hypothetical protein